MLTAPAFFRWSCVMTRSCLRMRRRIVCPVIRPSCRCRLLMRCLAGVVFMGRLGGIVFMRRLSGIVFMRRLSGIVFMRRLSGVVLMGHGTGMLMLRCRNSIGWLMICGWTGVMAWLSRFHLVFSSRPMFLWPTGSDPVHRRLGWLSAVHRVTLIPVIPGG
jgi:hypothetical protein